MSDDLILAGSEEELGRASSPVPGTLCCHRHSSKKIQEGASGAGNEAAGERYWADRATQNHLHC